MTSRRMRFVGLAAAGTLTAGLVAALPVAAAADTHDPVFYRGSAHQASVSRSVAVSAAHQRQASDRLAERSLQRSAGEQILQRINGAKKIGANGIAVAAGPNHVVQVGGRAVRIFVKATESRVGPTRTSQLFRLGSGISLSQPTIAYDPVGKRWFAAAVTNNGGDVGLVLRVSKGTNPTKWYPSVRVADATSGDPNPDVVESRPRIGVSANKLAITAVADDPSTPSTTDQILVFAKGSLVRGGSPNPWISDLDNTYDGQAPAVNATSEANLFVAIPDTNDVTLTTYSGRATSLPPSFSKSVTYPNNALSAPPMVSQVGGDTLDLGALAFNGVAWRSGKLFAAATVDCSGLACVRVFGLTTGAGVALTSDQKLTSAGTNWFSPSVAIARGGHVHLAANRVSLSGPSVAVLARKSSGRWTAPKIVAQAKGFYDNDGTPSTVSWWGGTSAAIDPSSTRSVWVTGAFGGSNTAPNPNLLSKLARVALG